MILLEYINAQIQVDGTSYAIISARPKNTNPMVDVYPDNGLFVWDFTGLQVGAEELVPGDPRASHFDFYIGLDDLAAYRRDFPITRARSAGLAAGGLRIPTRKVRTGGKPIAWKGPLARTTFDDMTIAIPPLKIRVDSRQPQIVNIDKEFSRYPIDNGNGRTTRELHFGFENPLIVRQNLAIKVPRIIVKMTPVEYATALEAIDIAIGIHRNLP